MNKQGIYTCIVLVSSVHPPCIFPIQIQKSRLSNPSGQAAYLSNYKGMLFYTFPVAAACQYKYFIRLIDGGEWSWDNGEDGGNRVMPLDLKAVDTVDAWKGVK